MRPHVTHVTHVTQLASVTALPGRAICGLALAVAILLFIGCKREQTETSASKSEQLYTCGMHPQVIQNHPGNCPICGMKLTPIRKTPGSNASATNSAAASANQGAITIDPSTMQNMGLRTELVTRGPVLRTIRTVGVIDYDETALSEVTTKFRGWIEKLYVDATGKQMHRGEPLFEIYSPELYLAQTEYLLTLHSPTNYEGAAAELRKASALTKLRYWDISEEQIADLKHEGKARKTLRVNAPRDGIVVEKMVVEGQMVEAGAKLYRLADLASVWIQAQVYEQDLAFVKPGQEAVVSLGSQPEPKFRGRVTYVYPMVDEKTRTAKVRLEFHNPGYFLKPGMYATIELPSEIAPSAVLVPDMAVLRSGERNTVFIALEGGKFEPRTIALGARSEDNRYEVLTGLKDGERVVTSGQFMLDSESQLREAIQKMAGNEPAGAHEKGSAAATDGPRAMTAGAATNVVYICPMPEHVSLQYEHPGKCPLCGMALVPVTPEMLMRIQPGGRVEYYTCPMSEHSAVHESKPGKCPRCGMTLIPLMTGPTNSVPMMENKSATLYTCPMASHADVVSDKPGKCEKCDMELVPTSSVPHGKKAEENWAKPHRMPLP